MADAGAAGRRWFWRAVTLIGLIALGSGTGGDVASLAQRFDPDTVFAEGDGAEENAEPATTTSAAAAAPSSTTTTSAPPPPEWTLYAGGDVLMDRSEAAGRDPFSLLAPSLAEADISVVNVEMAVAEGGEPDDKEFTFRAPPAAAVTMSEAGIDVGNLGNNHALDFGRDALLETIAHLREAGVSPVGAGATPEEAFEPALFDVGTGPEQVSVAVVGASDVVPEGWEVGSRPGIATTRQRKLVEAVEEAARRYDVVIVIVHWGVERAECPTSAQLDLGDALVDVGAAAVIGHHPHVLQPIVERGGTPIAYSLGNFVWHPRPSPQNETGILELRFRGKEYEGFTFHPHVLDENGDPIPAVSHEVERIEAAIERECGPGDAPTSTIDAPTTTAVTPPPD